MRQEILRRTIHPEVRVADDKAALVEYIASDESVDSYGEVIRAAGWRFDRFSRNAPFVDSHDYSTIDKLVGRVVDFRVEKRHLVETVQWAVDVPSNELARRGYEMTKAGYLRAVSVGFVPVTVLTEYNDPAQYAQQLAELDLGDGVRPRAIYLEQQQVELSAVIIGANAAALARGYKAGLLDERFLDWICQERARRETAMHAGQPADACTARQRAREQFLGRIEALIKRL